ncbi:MAG: TIM barrel protein [Clostridia bacterium]|nr:TIM barrel protein [Clostridia bacterium]
MKRALNAWTVEGSLDMEQTFAAVAGAGFEGIELNVDAPGAAHGLSMNTTAADYAAIRELSKKYNLPVCSISTSLWGGKLGSKEQWKDAEALLYKQIEAARELGADAGRCQTELHRLHAVPEGGNRKAGHLRRAGKRLERLLPLPLRHGILHRRRGFSQDRRISGRRQYARLLRPGILDRGAGQPHRQGSRNGL